VAKGRHRGNPAPFNWRAERIRLINRWRFFTKPKLIALLKGLK
jgi:hypothetical protein